MLGDQVQEKGKGARSDFADESQIPATTPVNLNVEDLNQEYIKSYSLENLALTPEHQNTSLLEDNTKSVKFLKGEKVVSFLLS